MEFLYPYADPRIVEFCLSTPVDLKGYTRYMIRSGTKGFLPDAIRLRVDKKSFSPDYYNRFKSRLKIVKRIFSKIKPEHPVCEIIDVESVINQTNYFITTNSVKDSHTIMALSCLPQIVNLLQFLKKNSWHRNILRRCTCTGRATITTEQPLTCGFRC